MINLPVVGQYIFCGSWLFNLEIPEYPDQFNALEQYITWWPKILHSLVSYWLSITTPEALPPSEIDMSTRQAQVTSSLKQLATQTISTRKIRQGASPLWLDGVTSTAVTKYIYIYIYICIPTSVTLYMSTWYQLNSIVRWIWNLVVTSLY